MILVALGLLFTVVVAMDLWGDAGPVPRWSFAKESDLGSKHDIVCDILSYDSNGDGALVSLYPCRTKARIMGGLNDLPPDVNSIAILGATYVDGMGLPGFNIEDPDSILFHHRIVLDDLFTVIELCCGIGVGTYGLEAAGFKIAVANDCNEAMLRGYSSLHPNVPLVLGNFADPCIIKQINRIHARSALLMSGFSCQPYSEGGAKHGYNDSRSGSLHSTLQVAFLLRCPIVLLECVRSASTNRHVRQELQQFRDQCHYHVTEIVLRLDDCWISKRERWYAVLSAPMIGPVPLSKMPLFGFPTMVKQVVPRGIDMSHDDMQRLILGVEEHERWKKFCPDIKSALIPLSGICPTALHSWGSQLTGCQCGCREVGFSDSTLSSRGIYGILFPCASEIELSSGIEQMVRHPHPTEVALLTGVPTPEVWSIDLKLALAGLGQQCAPFHVVWLAGQIRSFVERLHYGGSKVDCSRLLDDMRDQILLKSRQIFGRELRQQSTPSDDIPCPSPANMIVSCPVPVQFHDGGRDMVTIFDVESKTKLLVQLQHPAMTLEQLICAELVIHGTDEYPEVFDCQSQDVIRIHESIGGRCIRLVWRSNPFTQAIPQSPAKAFVEQPCTVRNALVDAISPTIPYEVDVACPEEEASDDADVQMESDNQMVPVDVYDIQEVYTEWALEGKHDDSDMHPECADGVGVTCDPPNAIVPVEMNDPVVALQKDQLCTLLRPPVGSFVVLETLMKQMIRTADRLTILDTQETLMADDEIRWHVNRILGLSGKEGWVQLDPLLLEEGLHRDIDFLLADFIRSCPVRPKAFVGAIRHAGHWIPFVWQWNDASVSIWSWDVSANHKMITPIHKAIARVLGVPNFIVKVEMRNFSNANLCGICAIRFIDCMVRGKMLPTCVEDVKHLHESGRNLFLRALVQQDFTIRPWTWGAGLDPKAYSRLHELLEQHGVPRANIDGRIEQATQAIGVHQLQQALVSSSPWKNLKAIANNSRPNFVWVLPAELQEVLQRKASQGQVGKSKKSNRDNGKKAVQPPPVLDPSKVSLEPGAFVRDDQMPLPQIQLSQIGPFAEGVVLATLAEMECHLKASQQVTQNALAAVVLNGGDMPPDTSLEWQQFRALVRCQANNEPLLVPALLVQLGRKPVLQAQMKSKIDVPTVPAACCKLSIYRDMIDGTWQKFIQGPVRYVFQHLPMFEVCSDHDCKGDSVCPKWHKPCEQIVNEPVLDVWRRQWLSLGFKGVAAEDASVFVVNIRYVKTLQEKLLAVSGRMGIFVEPRSLDARSPLLDYQVLWMKEPAQELFRIAQVNPIAIGLARLGSRLGIRTLTTHAPELAQQLKPGSIFLASGVKSTYELGPLPFGMDRLTVSKVCAQWGWQARPLFPIKTLDGNQGTVWSVQA